MTQAQTRRRPAGLATAPTASTAQAAPSAPDVFDALDGSGPRVCDDMTVEVALSVMAGARVGRLLLCDADEQCTGSVTRAQLTVVRDTSGYTDRMRVRDVLGAGGHDHAPGPLAVAR